jgi:hypothetical protein
MAALENVEINRAAQLKVIKDGGAEKPFGDQSPCRTLLGVSLPLIQLVV